MDSSLFHSYISRDIIELQLASLVTSSSGQDRGRSDPLAQSQYSWPGITSNFKISYHFITFYQFNLPQQMPAKPKSTWSQRVSQVNLGWGWLAPSPEAWRKMRLWLIETDHMTWILTSDWRIKNTQKKKKASTRTLTIMRGFLRNSLKLKMGNYV